MSIFLDYSTFVTNIIESRIRTNQIYSNPNLFEIESSRIQTYSKSNPVESEPIRNQIQSNPNLFEIESSRIRIFGFGTCLVNHHQYTFRFFGRGRLTYRFHFKFSSTSMSFRLSIQILMPSMIR